MKKFLFKIFSPSSTCSFTTLYYKPVKLCFFSTIFLGVVSICLLQRLMQSSVQRAAAHLVAALAALCFLCLLNTYNLSYAEETHFIKARERMIKEDLMGRDIKDPKVLNAMRQVKRHLFVDKRLQKAAYSDHPLPIEEGQTISQPYIVALMTQILNISPGEKVLEIGTGSGYQAAVLARLTDNVFSIEIKKELYKKTKELLKNLGYNTIKLKYGDGYLGWEEHAPFDAIIITAAANHVPPQLLKQLKTGGRLLLPLGKTTLHQTLTLITKREKDVSVQNITGVIFVPMTGKMQK